MNFLSLDRLLNSTLAGLPIGQKIKDYQQLLAAWSIAVGPTIALATRPGAIDRDILQVATASAALAQDLTFKRRQILAKLNPQLATPVRDIRFATRNWGDGQNNSGLPAETEQQTLWQQHPSRLNPIVEQISAPQTPSLDPQQAFQAWASRIKQQSQTWPLCPQCHCPTPPGELERWQVCGICAAKNWSHD